MLWLRETRLFIPSRAESRQTSTFTSQNSESFSSLALQQSSRSFGGARKYFGGQIKAYRPTDRSDRSWGALFAKLAKLCIQVALAGIDHSLMFEKSLGYVSMKCRTLGSVPIPFPSLLNDSHIPRQVPSPGENSLGLRTTPPGVSAILLSRYRPPIEEPSI